MELLRSGENKFNLFQPSLTKDWKPPEIYSQITLFYLALFYGLFVTVIACSINAYHFKCNRLRIAVLLVIGVLAMITQVIVMALDDEIIGTAIMVSRIVSLVLCWEFWQLTKARYRHHVGLGRETGGSVLKLTGLLTIGIIGEAVGYCLVKELLL